MQTMSFVTWLFGDVSLTQIMTGSGITAGGLWAGWKWLVSNKMTALQLNVDTQFRWRQIEEERRNKFQADILSLVATMKAENDILRTKLFESENTRLELMKEIGALHIEISSLKQEIAKLTAELTQMRRNPPHAVNG